MAAGQYTRLPPDRERQLIFFINPEQTSELVRLESALVAFDGRWVLGGKTRVHEEMLDAGISSSGVEISSRIAREYVTEIQAIGDETHDETQELLRLMDKAIAEGYSPSRLIQARRQSDSGWLEVATGESRLRLEELLAEDKRSPTVEAATVKLPELKAELGGEEWNLFRRYLLERVVPRMGDEMFFDNTKEIP